MELPDSPPAELRPAAEPAPESIGDPLGLCPGPELLLEAELSGGEDGALPGAGDAGVLLAMPPGDAVSLPERSVLLERFDPELLSRAVFLHAARPSRGMINAMASNVFKFMCSPPFVDFVAAEQLLLLFLAR